MPYPKRNDAPGMWHHVFNRGLARRPIFEGRRDMRFFLACLARAVRRGEIEILAYALNPNHYHLLARSPAGVISTALQRVQAQYVRHFNRTRVRDGPLFRGRFSSIPVETSAYRAILVKYIDANPVGAKLVASATDYPWCSRIKYAQRRGPPWLERSWIEEQVMLAGRTRRYQPRDYDIRFGLRGSTQAIARIERSIRLQDPRAAEAAAMLEGDPATSEWLGRRRWAADHGRCAGPVFDPHAVLCGLAVEVGPIASTRGRRARPVRGEQLIQAALLLELCGCSQSAAAAAMGLTRHQLRRLARIHREVIVEDAEYRRAFESAVRDFIAPPLL